MSDLPTYVLERVFDASPELVWRTWTEPKLLARWYGPNVETITHRLDLKAGGPWLVEKKGGGKSHYQRVEYRRVQPRSPALLLRWGAWATAGMAA